MNFNSALEQMKEGKKVRRPKWLKESYWMLDKKHYDKIICHNGTHANVYIEQIEATDWELYNENNILKMIETEKRRYIREIHLDAPNKVKLNARNIIKLGVNSPIAYIFGLEIVMDNRLSDEQAIVYYGGISNLSERRTYNPRINGIYFYYKEEDVKEYMDLIKKDIERFENVEPCCHGMQKKEVIGIINKRLGGNLTCQE
jgi:hypothetical protein